MTRGEVWWARLRPPAGRRPVVLLSREDAYSVRALVIVAPATTRARDIPAEVRLDATDGMPKRCVVNADVLTTIPKASLDRRITALSSARMVEVDRALRYALGLDVTRS
jgi:mRNA interferase MazF